MFMAPPDSTASCLTRTASPPKLAAKASAPATPVVHGREDVKASATTVAPKTRRPSGTLATMVAARQNTKTGNPAVCVPAFDVVLVLPLSSSAPPRPPVQILDAVLADRRSPVRFRPARPLSPTEQGWWREWRDAVARVVPIGRNEALASAIESAGSRLNPPGKVLDHTFSMLCRHLRTSQSAMVQLGKSDAMRLISLASTVDDLLAEGKCSNPEDFETWVAFADARRVAALMLARYGTGVTVECQ